MILINSKKYKSFCKDHPQSRKHLGYLRFNAMLCKSMRQAERGELIKYDEIEDRFYVE